MEIITSEQRTADFADAIVNRTHEVSDDAIVVGANAAGILAYPWSGSGFGTKFADPSTPPTFSGNGVAFSNV